MLLPNAVGNLQKGERLALHPFDCSWPLMVTLRYANVDYVFASALRQTHLLLIAISYDIVCQWFINLFQRMRLWPQDLKLRPGMNLRPFIPKFHAPAHKEEDHEQYSLNLAEGAGMTDGEAIKRVWAPHNALANSTKTAGPGTRQDILDDNFSFWNFQKYTSIGIYSYSMPCLAPANAHAGSTLMKRYKAAVSERNRQTEAHRGFTMLLPEAVVGKWEDLCIEWDASSFPKEELNPYKVDGAGEFIGLSLRVDLTATLDVTDAEAIADLKKVEADALIPGQPVLHEMSPVSFICQGLELEGMQ